MKAARKKSTASCRDGAGRITDGAIDDTGLVARNIVQT
jgi:hypothetical protein